MTLRSLRDNIGVVFQEPFIFARSIEENLRIGKPDATAAEMARALDRAQASDFVRDSPTAWRRSSASAGAISRGANASASPSRGRCSRTRRS